MPAPDVTPAMIATLTAELVAAFVSGNQLPPADIPVLIEKVYRALQRVAEDEEPRHLPKPAVPIRKSVTLDCIICLEDGKKLKMLNRYLRPRYRLTPTEYRARWSLPPDYPMVAEAYSVTRSEMAKRLGLGRRPRGRRRRRT